MGQLDFIRQTAYELDKHADRRHYSFEHDRDHFYYKNITDKGYPTGGCLATMHYINDVFAKVASELSGTTVFDPKKCPFYDENQWDFGIFRWDLIHYLGKTNDWVAGEILKEYKDRK